MTFAPSGFENSTAVADLNVTPPDCSFHQLQRMLHFMTMKIAMQSNSLNVRNSMCRNLGEKAVLKLLCFFHSVMFCYIFCVKDTQCVIKYLLQISEAVDISNVILSA